MLKLAKVAADQIESVSLSARKQFVSVAVFHDKFVGFAFGTFQNEPRIVRRPRALLVARFNLDFVR